MEQSQPNSGKLPSIFHGDWGKMLTYYCNDRVNYEGAAYLSLEDDNQNQPSSTSPAVWLMVKKLKEAYP